MQSPLPMAPNRIWPKLHFASSRSLDFPFLPVLFANLDPTRIPDSQSLDTSSPEANALAMLAMAMRSITILVDVREIPVGVYPELWPRIWTWMQCILLYRRFLSPPITEDALRAKFLNLLRPWIQDDQITDLIHETPGVHSFVARTWAGLPHISTPGFIATRMAVYDFIFTTSARPADLEELIEGAGGSADNLAKLLVSHIKMNCEGSTSLDDVQLLSLSYIIVFIRVGVVKQTLSIHSLLGAGLVGALTAALFPLSGDEMRKQVESATEVTLEHCVEFLSDCVCTEAGYPRLPEALDAGLLRAIVKLARMNPSGNILWNLQQFLCAHLPGGMVYYPVVAAIQSSIPPVEETPDADRFGKSPIFRDWLACLDLACERSLVFGLLHSPAYESIRFCNNYLLKCRTIKKRSDMKRCSGCSRAYYCSLECQSFAWKHGGHRAFCALQPHSPPPNRVHFPRRRDDAFMRLLILHHYQTNKFDILLKQLNFIHTQQSTKFCTVFDFMSGSGETRVVELEGSSSKTSALQISSNGIHRVVINGAGGGNAGKTDCSLTLDYVLRSSTSVISNGLVRLAASLPRDVNVEDTAKTQLLDDHVHDQLRILSEAEVVETYE
ncbi:hypothetical protein C8R47DRAFT_84729 [Mycena vitilis]|nr:hypothetical protein C8R47DRAFT_84729 [Mycena vitilis]